MSIWESIFGRRRRPSTPPTPPTPPAPQAGNLKGLYFQYGKPDPKMNADGVSSNWTAKPYVEPHYWIIPWRTPIKKSQTLAVTYKIEVVSGTPVIESTQCESWQPRDAKAALLIRAGANTSNLYNRAWTNFRPPMTIGSHTITAPLDGSAWAFVMGGKDVPANYPSKWDSLLSNVTDLALTFNGCSSAGHGAYVVGGTIKITIVSVVIS